MAPRPPLATHGATRAVALVTAVLACLLGLGVSPTAQAATTYALSGTITFPASAPASVRKALDLTTGSTDTTGVYLSVYGPVGKPSAKNRSLDLKHPDVAYVESTGRWSVTGLESGDYYVTINAWLPGGGSASGYSTDTPIAITGNTSLGTTAFTEQARLQPSFGSCRNRPIYKMSARNVATSKEYSLQPAQAGWDDPDFVGCPGDASFGVYRFDGAPVGTYIVWAEWQEGATTVREYFRGEKHTVEVPRIDFGTPNEAEATQLALKPWESTQITMAVGFTRAVSPGAPAITGTTKVGSKVAAQPGAWTTGTGFTYQWKRDGKAIAGATASSYTAVGADAKKKLTVTVTGTKSGYRFATATSAAKTIAPGTLTTTKPKIAGTRKVGKTLTVTRGSWTAGITFSYTWYRNGKTIKGATKSSYKLTKADATKTIKVKATGKKSGYTTASRTSSATSKIKS